MERAEAFEQGGRLELDRRALDPSNVHGLVGHWCLQQQQKVGEARACRCRESFVACSILDAQTHGKFSAPNLVKEMLVANLIGNGSRGAALLRCPELGRDREEALRRQIVALENMLSNERTAHADELKMLQRRVKEAEKELAQTEFKIMDAADAEHKLREEWGPELVRLRAESAKLIEACEVARTSQEKADTLVRENAFMRKRLGAMEKAHADAGESAARRVATAEHSAVSLRRALAQRRELLQKMLHKDLTAPLVSLVDSSELQAAVDEIRHALHQEVAAQKCCCCLEAPAMVVLLPCRHQQLCTTCADIVSVCPICRSHIASRLQVYT